MVRVYTDIWNDFQVRAPVYTDGHFEPYKFDVVKWKDCEPFEVFDVHTGETKMSSRYCFTIGTLIWDTKEPGFNFESCGLRYFEYRVDGLETFLMEFCKTMAEQFLGGE